MNTLSMFDVGYIVASLEGEGTLGMEFERADGNKSHSPHLQSYFTISNNVIAFLEKIKETLGCGYVYSHRKERKSTNQNTQYKFCIFKQSDQRELLEQMLPFLIIKKKQAILILEYLKIRKETPRGNCNGSKRSSREFEIYGEVKELNRRGLKET